MVKKHLLTEMDTRNSFGSNGNFKEHLTDDGALEYSADWNTFSFETELKARQNILHEDLKAYNKVLQQPCLENLSDIGETVVQDMLTSKKIYGEILEKNNDVLLKFKSLVEEQKNVRDNIEQLTAKNESLKQDIENLQEEEITVRGTYKSQKLALQKAYKVYTTNFGINISTRTLSDTTYEASLQFKNKDDVPPVKFTVDRKKKKIIDVQLNGMLSSKEEKNIRKEFGNLENIPGLFCALRDIIIKK